MTSKRLLHPYWQEIFLGILIFLYTSYFSWFTFARHDNLYSMRFDLGNMDQTVWNTSQGRIFTLTDPAGDKTISRFAIHADIFLVFLAPLYFLFPTPKTLLFVQSIGLALGAVPIFFLAKRVLKEKFAPILLSFSYLLYPAMQRANIFEFHAVTLATPLLLTAFYFVHLRRYGWFLFFAFLAATTKEEISLLIGGMALYIFLKNRDRLIGLLTFIISILWFVVAIWVVIPFYREGLPHFGVGFFSDFGNDPEKIISGFLFSPKLVWEKILSPRRLFYLYQLLLPVGFLSLFSPLIFLISLSELLINLMSQVSTMQTIYYQYTSGITPFIFISTIFGISFLVKRFSFLKTPISLYFLLMTFLGVYLFGPLIFARKPDLNAVRYPHPNAKSVHYISKIIPSSASMSITNNIAPHFTRRENVYSFPRRYDKADYSIVLIGGIYESVSQKKVNHYVSLLSLNPNYSLIFHEGNLFVFKRSTRRIST